MAKVLYEFINPHWRGVPYRDQMDIDKIWFGSSGISQGNGSCVSHGLGSAAYGIFGERADVPWILSWGSLKYGIIPCQQLEFAIEFAMESGLVLESEAPYPSVDMSRLQGTYGPIAAKHKFDLHIDYNNTAYGFDPTELKARLREGYILAASAGSALWGRFEADGMTLRWLTDEDWGAPHIVCIGGYQEREDGDFFIAQNSQPKITTHPQGFVYAPIRREGWYHFHALGLSTKMLNGGEGNNMVSTYSLKKDGNTKLSTNFKVSEFRCHDGSGTVLIDSGLVDILQRIRDHYGKAVNISSAYRTKSYNTSVGGASNSQHLYGTAADIRITGVDPRDIARWVETEINPGGLGLYDYAASDKSGFVHVDTRAGKSRWVQTKSTGSATTVGSIVNDYLDKGKTRPTVKLGSTGDAVTELETLLAAAGYPPIGSKADEATVGAIKAFQRDNGLTADGECGPKTWGVLTDK